jgi:hypothetical protein
MRVGPRVIQVETELEPAFQTHSTRCRLLMADLRVHQAALHLSASSGMTTFARVSFVLASRKLIRKNARENKTRVQTPGASW